MVRIRKDIVRIVIGVAIVADVSACDTVSCPPPPEARSSIVWDRASGQAGQLRGLVVSLIDGRPIARSETRLTPVDSTWRSTRAGEFRYSRSRTAAGGNLEVRAPGFASTVTAVTVPSDSSVVAIAVLSRVQPQRGAKCVNRMPEGSDQR